MNDRLMSLLGIARRAGKITMGNDAVKGSMVNGESALVLLTSDVSERTAKGIINFAESCGVNIIKINQSMDEVFMSLGKQVGILSINDSGFAKKVCSLVNNN